jgi:hypothetical protein
MRGKITLKSVAALYGEAGREVTLADTALAGFEVRARPGGAKVYAIRKTAGLDDVRLHDLRHAVASIAAAMQSGRSAGAAARMPYLSRAERERAIGYFEGIASGRGIAWRCSDSLSLREFLRLENREEVHDHSWLSKTRGRLSHEVHEGCSAGCCSSRPSAAWSRASGSASTPRRLCRRPGHGCYRRSCLTGADFGNGLVYLAVEYARGSRKGAEQCGRDR